MLILVHNKAKAGTAPSARDGGVAAPEAKSGGASGCTGPSCRWGPAAHALPPAGEAAAGDAAGRRHRRRRADPRRISSGRWQRAAGVVISVGRAKYHGSFLRFGRGGRRSFRISFVPTP